MATTGVETGQKRAKVLRKRMGTLKKSFKRLGGTVRARHGAAGLRCRGESGGMQTLCQGSSQRLSMSCFGHVALRQCHVVSPRTMHHAARPIGRGERVKIVKLRILWRACHITSGKFPYVNMLTQLGRFAARSPRISRVVSMRYQTIVLSCPYHPTWPRYDAVLRYVSWI